MKMFTRRALQSLLLLFLLSPALKAQGAQGPQAPDATAVLTLKRAVALAIQHSRDIALARVQYSIAQSEAGVNRAEFRPNLYTGSGAAYTSGFPAAPGGQGPSIFNLSYTQALYDPLLRGQVKAAEDRAEFQKLELDRTRDSVMVRAASTYLELAKVRHSLDLLRAERESQQRIVDLVRERLSSGLELPMEVTRGELTLARIEQHVIQLEGNDQSLTAQLRDMTGYADGQALEVEPAETIVFPEQSATELSDLALRNSPLVKEAEDDRSARQHILKGTRQSYFPSVSIIGEYEVLTKFNNYSEFYNHFQRNNVTVGLSINLPLFSAKTAANVTLARNQLAASDMTLSNTRQQVRIDVQQQIQAVRELDAGREVARLDLQLSRESLDATQEKYQQGHATLKDLEEGRLEENDKWIAFLDAEFARQKEELTLMQASGQLARILQ
jgi:outer membrane protein TolC